MLCVGNFFGPVKEDGTTDNLEVAQLLNGDIVGTPICLVPSCNALTKYLLCSPSVVLCDARRTSSTVPRDRKVRVKSGRDCQERVYVKCARVCHLWGAWAHPGPSGKSGIVTTPHGLRIACLGGVYDAQVYAESESPHVSLPGTLKTFL